MEQGEGREKETFTDEGRLNTDLQRQEEFDERCEQLKEKRALHEKF